ncbi:hypothetical protein AZE42_09171 [Rhizopogon vesiculosus]|uniref:Uncharacterized protein n=1 Tax=Rhizopogon vesiculosus TaxID=180088 RepID=A0A1J8Q6F7_9AGAM|nr:hypothetical protein AZE42_09171 [Rhizopogon vesiculosus]
MSSPLPIMFSTFIEAIHTSDIASIIDLFYETDYWNLPFLGVFVRWEAAKILRTFSDERLEDAGLTTPKLRKEPEDSNTFASTWLDCTVKDVNYIDLYPGSDKRFLLMTGDDHMIKVWDDLSKSCVQKMEGYYRTQVSLYSTRPTSSAAAKTAP